MNSNEITITRLCDLCHRDLEADEDNNSFPLSDGTCCDVCSNTIVIYTRKLCLERGIYYVTQKNECRALVKHMKQSGELLRLLLHRFPGLTPSDYTIFKNESMS
jgi:hypothetical protein